MISVAATKPKVLLSFDVEEFDTPAEWGCTIPFSEQIRISTEGFHAVLQILKERQLRATHFTTGRFAEAQPELIREAAQHHEIASHGLIHSEFQKSHLVESKALLEKITGKNILGFRRARLQPTPLEWISEAGYLYDSSENPTWIPGRYNHLRRPRTAHWEQGLLRLPASVTPRLRFPLFWLSFKHVPRPLLKRMLLKTLHHDGCLNLYFHPWEFADFSALKPPFLMGRVMGSRMQEILAGTLDLLQTQADFITFSDFFREQEKLHPSSPV